MKFYTIKLPRFMSNIVKLFINIWKKE
ncbi:stage V sporulation protein SpoVM [Pseudogracilibacillus sp. SO10305]|uniref:Stage V sporulation protein SpoVM n=1 Tax=Candidatus Pseudogracilibacillus intestinigallinarum TaxID=2838742 RepID=A0A9D1PLC2_9BACI|nr:stage V sporulation protein SpoVM [Candidatus Pseudogracilibacillus intestinigallinarum]